MEPAAFSLHGDAPPHAVHHSGIITDAESPGGRGDGRGGSVIKGKAEPMGDEDYSDHDALRQKQEVTTARFIRGVGRTTQGRVGKGQVVSQGG